MKISRRKSLKSIATTGVGLSFVGTVPFVSCSSNTSSEKSNDLSESAELFFSISLGQWSLHKSFFGVEKMDWVQFGKLIKEDPDVLLQGDIDPLDFPVIARRDFGIDAVEYVNTFYFSKSGDMDYWAELKNRCDSEGVSSNLIMCDREGDLGNTNEEERIRSVENHYKWVDVAKYLGCHSIRVNAAGSGTEEEIRDAAVDGLGRLTEYGSQAGINIIVENHGGYSSNGKWLSSVISQVGSEYCGTLPDFGNFCMERGPSGCLNEYDRYQGVEELMPFAKGVSAKSYNFDEEGDAVHTDFTRMLKIVKDAGFQGHIGIEYEGNSLSEYEGIKATKKLLEKTGRMV